MSRDLVKIIAAMKEPTPTQLLYLQMLIDGLNQKQIAHASGRSAGTVKASFRILRNRLGVETLFQAVAVAATMGWIKTHPSSTDL